MNILDVAIILALLLGAVLGFKRGLITSVVMFAGTIVVIVLAFILKNPISELLYTYLPFFKFGGVLQGVSVINILIYEAIAFLVVCGLLTILLKILLGATRLIEKLLNATIILGIPSKILGAIFGLAEAFLFLFIGLFAIKQFNWFSELTNDSKLTNKIINSTPVLSNSVEDAVDSFTEIYRLQDKYATSDKNGEAYNREALDILLKHEVITAKSVRKLDEKGKINIKDLDSLLSKYEE